MRHFTTARGSYVLVIHLQEDTGIDVGSLGERSFPAGWYLYVGSAMAGLQVRIRRHFNRKKTPRWHVDYLTNRALANTIVLFQS